MAGDKKKMGQTTLLLLTKPHQLPWGLMTWGGGEHIVNFENVKQAVDSKDFYISKNGVKVNKIWPGGKHVVNFENVKQAVDSYQNGVKVNKIGL